MAEFIYDNQSIHYEFMGTRDTRLNTPILMLHGNGENMHIFDNTIAPLLNSRCFVLMDSRTQGESYTLEGGSKALSYTKMAEDAIELMKSLNIGEYDIVGYSDGGIIALLMAMKSYNVRRVITLGVNISPEGLTPRAVREIKSLYRRAKRKKDEQKMELMRLMLEEPNIPISELSSIFAETTIVLGRKDNIINRKHSESIADAIPRSSHMYIDGAEHDIPITHANVLCDLIKTLL